MLIENIMYFALGLLMAGLVALIIMPAVWKRAVRLTKRRIEAATPITMAEFRADKDQLRAEFALSTRRLEMNVEALRKRLADQLSEVNQKRTDLGALKIERDQHLSVVKELEVREAELRARVLELERDGTDLAQRLRMRDRELESRTAELAALRDGEAAPDATQDSEQIAAGDSLIVAEAQIASAENRLNALLAETTVVVDRSEAHTGQLLANKLGMESELERLRAKVSGVEASILADWDSERVEDAHLRERLNDIAASVSRLVYAVDHDAKVPEEESLFERVQRFADDGAGMDILPEPPRDNRRGTVSDRMTALREIQSR